MADAGRWKQYVQRRVKVWGEWNVVAAACNLRRLFALGIAPA